MKKTFKIEGMNCNSCAHLIETELKEKVNSISVSYANEKAEIEFDENRISENQIIDTIQKLGYTARAEISSDEEDRVRPETNQDITQDSAKESADASVVSIKSMPSADYNITGPTEVISQKRTSKARENKNVRKEEHEEYAVPPSTLNYHKKRKKAAGEENKGFDINTWAPITIIVIAAMVFFYRFLGYNFTTPDIQIPQLGENTSLILLFIAGLLTGFHCIGMCGGFVVSYTTKNALNGHKSFRQHLVYGSSKVLSYALIGGIFGLIGGIFAFSAKLRGWVAILAGVFMIFYALSMFGIKFFRKFQFNPKFLTRIASAEASRYKGPYSRPFITGLLNGLFIACGPLQAMYLYAAGTGNFINGTASLAAFGLGTLPVMLGFGSLTTLISHKTTKKILKISAVIVLILGLIMLNRGLTLMGNPINFSFIKQNANLGASTSVVNGVQEVNMQVDASGYHPNSFVIKQGVPVKWNVNVNQLTGCNSELVLNQYNIDVRLKQGLNIIQFTPDKAGILQFSCGMGMLRGGFIVTDTGTASQQQIKAATPPTGMQCGGSGGGGCGCGG